MIRSKRKSPEFKSVFADNIQKFVAYKRAQGYKYKTEEILLAGFDKWCIKQGINMAVLDDERISAWLAKRDSESPKTHTIRVQLLGQFSKFLHILGDSDYVVPAPVRVPSLSFVPYIFSRDELVAMFRVMDSMKESATLPHNREIYPMFFRLLYGCGFRVSELCNLKKVNVDCKNGIITVMGAKENIDRLVPLSEPLTDCIRVYMQKMNLLVPNTLYVFPNRIGENIAEVSVYGKFRDILFKAGIPHYGRGKGPRLHDFRHTFAVHSMQKMADEGMDLYCTLPILSTYLGHADASSTEKYQLLTEEMHGSLLEQVFQMYGDIVPLAGKGVRFEN